MVELPVRATVAQPQRFARSKTVGAHFGFAPRHFQCGKTDHDGRISKCENAMMRTVLYEAARVLLTRNQKWSRLKTWGMQLARRPGGKKKVALARRLAAIPPRRKSAPRGNDGREFAANLVLLQQDDATEIVTPHPSDPIAWRPSRRPTRPPCRRGVKPAR